MPCTKEDDVGNPQDVDRHHAEIDRIAEYPDRRVDGIEMCQDYRMDRCTRGDRCKFSHGEDDSDEKKARFARERKRREDKENRERERRRRTRSRSRRSRSRNIKGKRPGSSDMYNTIMQV